MRCTQKHESDKNGSRKRRATRERLLRSGCAKFVVCVCLRSCLPHRSCLRNVIASQKDRHIQKNTAAIVTLLFDVDLVATSIFMRMCLASDCYDFLSVVFTVITLRRSFDDDNDNDGNCDCHPDGAHYSCRNVRTANVRLTASFVTNCSARKSCSLCARMQCSRCTLTGSSPLNPHATPNDSLRMLAKTINRLESITNAHRSSSSPPSPLECRRCSTTHIYANKTRASIIADAHFSFGLTDCLHLSGRFAAGLVRVINWSALDCSRSQCVRFVRCNAFCAECDRAAQSLHRGEAAGQRMMMHKDARNNG